MSLYDSLAAEPGGTRRLAAGRLRFEIHEAIATAERACHDPAAVHKALTRRERRRIYQLARTTDAIANYLHDLGFELDIKLVDAGQPRADVLARRAAHRKGE